MRRLATEVGIQAPSLYKHVGGKDAVVLALQARALRRQADELGACRDLPSLARAFRAWALRHPQLYELISRHELERDRLPAGVEEAAARPLMEAVGYDVARARALWACAHGLVDLELAGRFPADADLDGAWAAAVAAFGTGTPGA